MSRSFGGSKNVGEDLAVREHAVARAELACCGERCQLVPTVVHVRRHRGDELAPGRIHARPMCEEARVVRDVAEACTISADELGGGSCRFVIRHRRNEGHVELLSSLGILNDRG